jgi:hypothetical protein
VLTVLTLFSLHVLILIILVPLQPSRENVISMPSIRRNVCARRRRPASARGFFAHAMPRKMSGRPLSAHERRRSDALPLHMVRPTMIARTQVAIGSTSMILSIAALRFAAYARANVPAGHSAGSQAVAQRAKSAMRGSRSRWTWPCGGRAPPRRVRRRGCGGADFELAPELAFRSSLRLSNGR